MKLRLKKGAVVKLELIGTGEPIFKVGKVDNVLDDEVVLIEQISIKLEEENGECTFMNYLYDPKRTVDGKTSHINRALIASWEYASRNTAARSSYENPDLSNATFTYYDENGYCYGDGMDFSNITESLSSYIVVGKPNDDSEGLELSL